MENSQGLKILYGITKSNLGGAQRYVFDMAIESALHGHKVKVLCGGNGLLVDKLKENDIPVITLPTLSRDVSFTDDASAFLDIYRVLIKQEPDVFHINASKMGLGALAGRLAGVPKIIFTAHGWAFNENRSAIQKAIIKIIYWFTILLSHQTICVSEKLRSQIKNWPFIQKKLIVIKNGIGSIDLWQRENAREELVPGILPTTLLVGILSELHHIKGIDVALKAWQEFSKGADANLIILGTGDEQSNLINMAQNLDISGSVVFKGFVLDAKKYLKALDIFLMPSRSEGLPYALLEAGFAELAIVATAVGGIPEVIEDGKTGLLIPKDDPQALSEALSKLSEESQLRKTLGKNFKKNIEEKFMIDKMVHDTLKVYEL